MGLAVLVEDRLGRVLAHVRRAHFVNAEAQAAIMFATDLDVLYASALEHFTRVGAHAVDHLLLVVAEAGVDVDDGNAPFVDLRSVERDPVFRPRKHFAEAADANVPWSGLAEAGLELGTDAGLAHTAAPVAAHDPALEAKAAEEGVVLLRHVAVARDVESVGTAPVMEMVEETRIGAAGADRADMIHQVTADR